MPFIFQSSLPPEDSRYRPVNMGLNRFAVLSLATFACAFPSLAPSVEKRQGLLDEAGSSLGLSDLLSTVEATTNTVEGLLGSIAESVNPDNLRPEPGFEFVEPGPNDSRGPCPGLNLLANYGYLPRDGHVNSGQVSVTYNSATLQTGHSQHNRRFSMQRRVVSTWALISLPSLPPLLC